jgi:hypothetical protein
MDNMRICKERLIIKAKNDEGVNTCCWEEFSCPIAYKKTKKTT